MLTINVKGDEFFDDATAQFVTEPDFVVELEHSLAILSKWESKHEKPFLSREAHSDEESIDYIRMMVQTPDVPPEVFTRLLRNYQPTIEAYISSKQTATWFREEENRRGSQQIITAEVVYYWMMSAAIPLECEHWHLNRLLTLLRVFSAQAARQQPNKSKVSKADMLRQRQELNAKRREQMQSAG